MRKFSRTLLAGGACLFIAAGLQAEPEPQKSGLEALMTPEQYRQAGLHKLNEQERAALYQWLQGQQGAVPVASVEAPAKAATPMPAAAAPVVTPAAAATVAPPNAAPASTAAPAATSAPAPAPAPAPAAVPAAEPTIAASKQASAATEEANFGLPEPRVENPEERFQLHATVKEPFRGWSGKTLFYLDNGQVWKQRTSGRHTYTGDDNRVVISQNRFGFFEMRLLAVDRSVGVKRVK